MYQHITMIIIIHVELRLKSGFVSQNTVSSPFFSYKTLTAEGQESLFHIML